MTNASAPGLDSKAASSLRTALWIVQSLLFVLFAGTGLWKLLTPIPKLATMIPWAGEVSPGFLYMTAAFDLLGGLGVLLPAVTRIKPSLTWLAGLGCAALQVCAIAFHVMRGEGAKTPFNALLVALALFVFWGRRAKAPVPPRGQ